MIHRWPVNYRIITPKLAASSIPQCSLPTAVDPDKVPLNYDLWLRNEQNAASSVAGNQVARRWVNAANDCAGAAFGDDDAGAIRTRGRAGVVIANKIADNLIGAARDVDPFSRSAGDGKTTDNRSISRQMKFPLLGSKIEANLDLGIGPGCNGIRVGLGARLGVAVP